VTLERAYLLAAVAHAVRRGPTPAELAQAEADASAELGPWAPAQVDAPAPPHARLSSAAARSMAEAGSMAESGPGPGLGPGWRAVAAGEAPQARAFAWADHAFFVLQKALARAFSTLCEFAAAATVNFVAGCVEEALAREARRCVQMSLSLIHI
jgi:hypothetical protein